MSQTRIVVCGAGGRMGRAIVAKVQETEGATLVGAVDQAGSTAVGEDAGALAGVETAGIQVSADLEAVLGQSDVVIDFTQPAGTVGHARAAAAAGVAFVTGTTGLSAEQVEALTEAAENVPMVRAPNMSQGVTMLLRIVEELARLLPDYDVEVVETHHRRKVDAPSGTALRLAAAAAEGRSWDLERVGNYGRHGAVGPRPDEEIGVMTLRAGDVVGDHTVMLAGPGERVEVTHRAHSRGTFAAGAVRAAVWVVSRPAGVYDMGDVLGVRPSRKD